MTSILFQTLKKSLLGIIILFSIQVLAKENDADTSKIFSKNDDWISTTSLYFELGGKLVPSLNLDIRKNENFAICISTGFWKDGIPDGQLIFTPSVNAYYLFGNKKRMEIGGGTGPFLGTSSGLVSFLIFANIGYRYQKKNGLIFRAGFTPFVAIPVNNKSTFWISPWAGISIGYSF
jgi:hypothetical protein